MYSSPVLKPFLTHSQVRKLASSAPMLLCGSFSKLAHAVFDPESLLRARRAAMTKNAEQSTPQPMEDVAHPDRLMVTPDAQETAYATRIAEWASRTKVLSAGVDTARGARTSAAASAADPRASNGAIMSPVVVRPQRHLLRIGEIVEGQFCDLLGMASPSTYLSRFHTG